MAKKKRAGFHDKAVKKQVKDMLRIEKLNAERHERTLDAVEDMAIEHGLNWNGWVQEGEVE